MVIPDQERLLLQLVLTKTVTCVSHIEVFVTAIKLSRVIKAYLRANQGIKVTSKLQQSTDQEHMATI